MAKIKQCKTCGKDFECCTSCLRKGFFYWKSVCCSIECYQEYAKKVLEERSKTNER